MGKAGTDPCFLKLTANGVVETQGYGQGSGGYYSWGRGRIGVCCLYAIGMREVEDTGEETV